MYVFIDILDVVDPFQRGFFCDDVSLMHPYRPSTVNYPVLVAVGISIPIALFLATEIWRWRLEMDDNHTVKLFNRDFPYWALNVYKNVGVFLFGLYASTVMTDFGKVILGRFRPHFMTVCQPILPDGTNCTDVINRNRYIEEFTCGSHDTSEYQLKDMRRSFPSGHSSSAMFMALYTVLYLHSRMNWDGSRLLKPFLQFLLIMMAWFTALSRISDYKHHCKYANNNRETCAEFNFH